jgi:hypothetical protein
VRILPELVDEAAHAADGVAEAGSNLGDGHSFHKVSAEGLVLPLGGVNRFQEVPGEG